MKDEYFYAGVILTGFTLIVFPWINIFFIELNAHQSRTVEMSFSLIALIYFAMALWPTWRRKK